MLQVQKFLERLIGGSKEEKKVEYVELIYDLIFVYIIGRNNSLMTRIVDGFIDPESYFTYIICTLITIQIWYMTTLFINRYGSNEPFEYIGLFVNMFLLYYMADGTRLHWQTTFYRYNVAWMLILVNIQIQYLRKYRTSISTPWEAQNIKVIVKILAAMITIIGAGIGIYHFTGLPLTPVAMLAGMVLFVACHKSIDLVAIDFPHLTERIMLYIVFTFGEMIIAISGYFDEKFSLVSLYYALCAFLIVVGLFTSYGFMYDNLIDREMSVRGNMYMLVHVFIIFALSNLTAALEFMPEHEIDTVKKNVFLIVSFAIYYIFIFALAPFTKGYERDFRKFSSFIITLAGFIVLMAMLFYHPAVSIALSAAMAFRILYLEYKYWRIHIKDNPLYRLLD